MKRSMATGYAGARSWGTPVGLRLPRAAALDALTASPERLPAGRSQCRSATQPSPRDWPQSHLLTPLPSLPPAVLPTGADNPVGLGVRHSLLPGRQPGAESAGLHAAIGEVPEAPNPALGGQPQPRSARCPLNFAAGVLQVQHQHAARRCQGGGRAGQGLRVARRRRPAPAVLRPRSGATAARAARQAPPVLRLRASGYRPWPEQLLQS